MTEILKQTVLDLVKAALDGKRAELAAETDLQALYDFSLKQNLIPLVYYGLVASGMDKNSPWWQKFFFATCQCIAISEQQNEKLYQIFSAFEEKKIDFLPLKGAHLRGLYPKGEMRAMGDIDILIREEQYESIRDVMTSLGFVFQKESNHESVWSSGKVVVELHRYLIPSYNKDYYAYFGSGWEKAVRIPGKSEFQMTKEDEFIYLFTHFTKHYRDGGIGIKHLLDLKQYLEKNKPDMAYLKDQLSSLKLWEFFSHTKDLIAFWFDEGKEDAAVLLMEKVLFSGGAFGTEDAHEISSAVKEGVLGQKKSRKEKFFSRVFLSYSRMCKLFPLLKKVPVLLPFFWIYRIFYAFLFKREALSENYREVQVVSEKNVSGYEKELALVGLAFRLNDEE